MKFLRRQEGTAMIEVAVVLPLLTFLLLAVGDFAVLFNQSLSVADSARAAAEGAIPRAYTTNTTFTPVVGAGNTYGISNYTINAVTYCTCAAGVGIASCASHSSCGVYGIPNQYVKVTATATLPLLFSLTGFAGSIKVQSVAINRTSWTGTN